jgi:NADH dehydrogenase (ubiquinone) 1 alpha subcomplex subunit 6
MKEVKAVLSTSNDEARKRVLNLYKMWYREMPYVGKISPITLAST